MLRLYHGQLYFGARRSSFWNDLYHWQALLWGLFGLVPAIATVWYLRKQNKQNENQHRVDMDINQSNRRDDMYRKHRAARAGLPLAIDTVSQYAIECFALLNQSFGYYDQNGDLNRSLVAQNLDEPPSFPIEALEVLRRSVETADEQDAQKLSQLISFAQIHRARFEDHLRDVRVGRRHALLLVDHVQVQDRLIDIAVLYAACGWLFPYARAECDSISEFPNKPDIAMLTYTLSATIETQLVSRITQNWKKLTQHFRNLDQ